MPRLEHERQFWDCHLNDDSSLLSCDADGPVYRSRGFGVGADMWAFSDELRAMSGDKNPTSQRRRSSSRTSRSSRRKWEQQWLWLGRWFRRIVSPTIKAIHQRLSLSAQITSSDVKKRLLIKSRSQLGIPTTLRPSFMCHVSKASNISRVGGQVGSAKGSTRFQHHRSDWTRPIYGVVMANDSNALHYTRASSDLLLYLW